MPHLNLPCCGCNALHYNAAVNSRNRPSIKLEASPAKQLVKIPNKDPILKLYIEAKPVSLL